MYNLHLNMMVSSIYDVCTNTVSIDFFKIFIHIRSVLFATFAHYSNPLQMCIERPCALECSTCFHLMIRQFFRQSTLFARLYCTRASCRNFE